MSHDLYPAVRRRPRWCAPPWPVSALVTAAVGFSCLPIIVSRDLRGTDDSFLPTALALTTVAGVLAVQFLVDRRFRDQPPKVVAAGALAIQAALIEVLTQVDGLSLASIMYLALPYPAVSWLGARAGVSVCLAILAWFTIRFSAHKPLWSAGPEDLHSYALFALAIMLVTTTALLIRREQASRRHAERLLDELGTSHDQLVDSQARVAELAAIEERNRLARDIHDSLGHHLTVISVQLEKAQVLLPPGQDTAATAIGNAKRLADQALTDVRQSVDTLRRDRAPFVLGPALRSLAADLQVLPFELELTITGDEHRYSGQQLVTLYRAAQEGLTNVQRHARANQVRLTVELGDRSARLTLDDDGIGPPITPGNGLRGVRERVELVSGRLTLLDAPGGGTRLAITLPRAANGEA
ncbi:sensor histidine kinase [Kribbella sp. NBC_01245]|uniref:sensor histidine kinase n=1 Tax=Kribbella sp. NBC_01245 TaxID=2903578 RepID=UPI002E27E6F5|nr:sensor histidine kinase [Kribbella sp. NBC_01245]